MTAQDPTLLITGAAGQLASFLAPKLAERYQLVGADILPEPRQGHFPGSFYQLDYTKRSFGDIFRKHPIATILHLGRIKPTRNVAARYRFHQNVVGTRSILNMGWKHGVKHFVVVSSHQVYGAFRENYLYLREDESLRAQATVSDLADAVELDHESREFMWQHRSARVTVLRPVHLVGPSMEGPLMMALRGPVSPTLLGFDPLMQFLHEEDFARAIELVLGAEKKRGVFNLAGEGAVPFSDALRLAGTTAVPTIGSLFPLMFRLAGYQLPKHFLDHLKYPIVVSDQSFRKEFGFKPQLSLQESLQQVL